MSEACFKSAKPNETKPRLSLLTKQSGIKLNSSDEQSDHQVTIISPPESKVTDQNRVSQLSSNSDKNRFLFLQSIINDQDIRNCKAYSKPDATHLTSEDGVQQDKAGDIDRTNITRGDLINLLAMLKSELHSKEIALAAIKCEQLKRLINPVEISRSSLASNYIELQNKLKTKDQNNNPESCGQDTQKLDEKSNNASVDPVSPGSSHDHDTGQQSKNLCHDRESLDILNTLLDLLDRHPLLALPRDSIYCLDFNCNEISTKNYLNLKIQHLDELINQHRRFRYCMNENLKRSEQRVLELTQELELERERHLANDNRSPKKGPDELVYIKHIQQMKEEMEREKGHKQAIVTALFNELLDEKEKNERLFRTLSDIRSTTSDSSDIIKEKNERVIHLEEELAKVSSRLKEHIDLLSEERKVHEAKTLQLEGENSSLKTKLDAMEKKLISKEPNSPNSNKPRSVASPVKQSAGSGVSSKNPIASSPTRTSTSPATARNTSNTRTPTNRVSPHNSTSQLNQTSKPIPSSSGARKASTQTGVAINILSGSNSDVIPVRIQPLFKSNTSATSSSVQAKTFKSSASVDVNTIVRNPTTSRPANGTKPQVPAKPVTLMDSQRNSLQ